MSRYFWPILTPPPPVTLCHTSRDPPKVRHTSRTPPFLVGLVQKSPDKIPLYKFSLNCSRGFLFVFCLDGFVRGAFLSVPPSVGMHVLQQKVKHHLKFHVSYV